MTALEPIPSLSEPVLPDYGGGCVANIVPALLDASPPRHTPLPESVIDARAVVLVVFDGLGAQQLAERPRVAPTMSDLQAATITTVAPSTTAAALTSISTGVPPGEHGIVGYRIRTFDGNLNILKWKTPVGETLLRHPPEQFQPLAAFSGHRPPALQNEAYRKTGFSRAYLRDARRHGFKMLSSLTVIVRRLLSAGESFIYCYYEGLDIMGHEHGLGEHYDAELSVCDRLLADLATVLPRGAALIATSDHGMVDCSAGLTEIDRSVLQCAAAESGEARFRWLHAHRGRARDLRDAATEAHGDQAWVVTGEQVIDEGWLGPTVSDVARERLGDVALVARADQAFLHSSDGSARMIGRHGSLTAAEMLVPLLVHVA